MIIAVTRAMKEHGAVTLLWRWFTGHPWHGKPYTDAGWFRHGTKALTVTGHAHRWHHMPRIHRTGIRTVATIATPLFSYAIWKHRTGALEWLACVAGWVILTSARPARDSIRSRNLNQNLVYPLAVPLAPMLGLSEMQARKAISIRPDYATVREGEIGKLALPVSYAANPAQRREVAHLVTSRLPVDADFTWDMQGKTHALRLIAAPECPSMVPFTDMLEAMAACKPGEVVIGVDRHGHIFKGSFTGDDPHWGFSVGSGRGKSTFLIITAAQLLHNEAGATITGIDPKMASLNALAGVPGVTIANDPRNVEGMWKAIEAFEREMMRRLDALNTDPTATFPIAVLMIDELNQFSSMSKAQWRKIKGKGDQSYPPVWDSVAAIHWMGRQVRCHCVSVGQRLDDKATGGIGLRDSMGFRGLAGFRSQQWDMLINTKPIPRSQKPKGRWIYSDGQTETWVQNMLAHVDPNRNAQIIRDYAMTGRRAGVTSPTALPASSTAVPETVAWVTGLDAGAAHVGLTVAAFRKRRERAGGIPGETRHGNKPAWSMQDLDNFAHSERETA
jgi:hypothetical protein